MHYKDFPHGSDGKASAYNAGDLGSILGSGRSPVEGNDNPLQYSCLENPMDCSLPGSSVHGILQQEYWSRLPFPSPGDLPDPRIEPRSPAVQADSLPTERLGKLSNTQ